MNQYSSAIMREQTYGSRINKKNLLVKQRHFQISKLTNKIKNSEVMAEQIFGINVNQYSSDGITESLYTGGINHYTVKGIT